MTPHQHAVAAAASVIAAYVISRNQHQGITMTIQQQSDIEHQARELAEHLGECGMLQI